MNAKDKYGKVVEKGMRVKIVACPELPDYMIEESLHVFESAVGKIFEVYETDDNGQTWIEVDGDLPKQHAIGLEPECVEIVEI